MSELKFRAFVDNDMTYFTLEDLVNYMGDLFHESRGDAALYDFLLNGAQPDRYTGCKDKNGVEIYENDIVKYGFSNKPELVRWCNETEGYSGFYLHGFLMPISSKYEIIGNIHQSPELLEETK